MRLLAATLLCLWPGAALQAEIAAPLGRVILTVAGDLPEGNAPAGTADDTTLFGYLGLDFPVAVGFDDAMLAALPQQRITAQLIYNDAPVTYSGPRLSDVITAAGAAGKSALPMAIDGYQAEISWDDMGRYRPIVATHLDGAPLPLGGLGPAMIVFPVVDDQDLTERFKALQVWAMIMIEVE